MKTEDVRTETAGVPVEALTVLNAEAQRCPYELHRRLRNEAPVHWDRGLNAFVVSRFDLVCKAALDTAVFSSAESLAMAPHSPEAARIRARTYTTRPLTVSLDPPQHTQYRRIMNSALSPRRMREAKPLVEGLVEELLGPFVARGGGDVVEEFSIPLPFAVVSALLGLPREKLGKMREWAASYIEPLSAAMSPQGRLAPERELECAHLYVEYHQYFEALIEERRAAASPPDDLVTAVALARLDSGELMPMADALSMIEQFVVAGAETTTNALSMGLLALARQPELLVELRSRDDRVDAFVEEVLRLYAPAQGLFRTATCDTELGGVRIPRSSRVMLRWGAANTDEAVFPHGEDLDLDRPNSRNHLAFGYGIHRCQGAPLARIELAAAFRYIARAAAALRLEAGEDSIEYIQVPIFMGLKHLRLRIEPLAAT